MPPGEFELIARHFTGRGAVRDDVRISVGDDAAVVTPRAGAELVLALDTIVADVHFPADTGARFIGHRALAVNLSDLAAMGAEPAWALLGLTLPAPDESWLLGFAAGLDELARRFGVALIGGDTTRGPLAATVTVGGWVPAGRALTRDGARAGDDLWVSGTPGDAGAGLAILQGRLETRGATREELLRRFLLPEPRVGLGLALRDVASACIDISDGLAGDLEKLCRASGVGARLDCARLPRSASLLEAAGDAASMRYALAAGDDYELLFTAPAAARLSIERLAQLTPLSCIGSIAAEPGVHLQGAGTERDLVHGFDHFAGWSPGPR
ncbi:MAG: thiamine-phosphate kinase [Steroidobacteraceae bacterium]